MKTLILEPITAEAFMAFGLLLPPRAPGKRGRS